MEKDKYVESLFNDLVNEIDYTFEQCYMTKKQKATLTKMLIAYLILTINS